MSDQSTFQVGAFVGPLTSSTTNPLLQDADPALFAALGFYQAVLQTHLGARFDAEFTRAGLSQFAGKCSSLAIPYDPLPYLLQEQVGPPFLALFAVEESFQDRTRGYYQTTATHKLQWVLPPFTPAQAYQLSPFLRAAVKVILDRTELGYDPAYQSGAQFCAAGGIAQLNIVRARYGSIQGLTSNLNFPTVELELELLEERAQTPGLLTFAGTDGTLQLTDAAGGNAVTVVQTQTTGF